MDSATRRVAPFLAALAFAVFYLSPVAFVSDSRFSMALSQHLWEAGNFELDAHLPYLLTPENRGRDYSNTTLYTLRVVDGHVYYFFPPGSSLLSVPFVALFKAFGVAPLTPEGTVDPAAEFRVQRMLASALSAALVVLFFATARCMLSWQWSVVVALAAGFGTPIWSSVSRVLWSHTWGSVLLGCAVLLLVRKASGRGGLHSGLLATLLAWSYIVRPTFSLSILGISVYLALVHRDLLARTLLVLSVWLLGFAAYSWAHFGALLPPYYRANRLGFDTFWTALAGNLVSPSRGLLVFTPVLLFVAYLHVRYRRRVPLPALAVLAWSVVAAHLLVISMYPHWWAGHSYGPRLASDVTPWLALLGAMGVRGWLRARSEAPSSRATVRRIEASCGAIALAISIVLHGQGALIPATLEWNESPVNIDVAPSRLWDWSDAQFLAAFRSSWPNRSR